LCPRWKKVGRGGEREAFLAFRKKILPPEGKRGPQRKTPFSTEAEEGKSFLSKSKPRLREKRRWELSTGRGSFLLNWDRSVKEERLGFTQQGEKRKEKGRS